jgi:hypothetical protein
VSPAGLGNGIVQVKDVDPVKTQSRQTALERHRDRIGNAAELTGRQPDLGADGDVGGLQLLQNPAKVLFRFAITVLHRGVKIVHAGGDRACDGTLLFGRIAAYHKSAHGAAAEAQHRELHSRAPKNPQLHRASSLRRRASDARPANDALCPRTRLVSAQVTGPGVNSVRSL